MPTKIQPKQVKNHASLKLVFFYILTFAALYVSIVSYLNLLFAYVNVKFPETLTYGYTSSLNRIRLTTSILIVVWTLYVFTQWLIAKDLTTHKQQPERSGKKLLTYLTLLLSTVTVAVDLIVLIYNFYSGGFTTPFLLKILTVFIVAAAVFGYYRWDLKRTFGKKTNIAKISGWVVSAVLLGSIVVGFFIAGSPTRQRDIRFDEQRVSDLQQIQSQILDYWTRKSKLPVSLADLNDDISGYQTPTDPETKAGYSYKKTGELTFQICATFKTSQDYRGVNKYAVPVTSPYDVSTGSFNNWNYNVGETCFDRTIDPTIYKPTPTIKD